MKQPCSNCHKITEAWQNLSEELIKEGSSALVYCNNCSEPMMLRISS